MAIIIFIILVLAIISMSTAVSFMNTASVKSNVDTALVKNDNRDNVTCEPKKHIVIRKANGKTIADIPYTEEQWKEYSSKISREDINKYFVYDYEENKLKGGFSLNMDLKNEYGDEGYCVSIYDAVIVKPKHLYEAAFAVYLLRNDCSTFVGGYPSHNLICVDISKIFLDFNEAEKKAGAKEKHKAPQESIYDISEEICIYRNDSDGGKYNIKVETPFKDSKIKPMTIEMF